VVERLIAQAAKLKIGSEQSTVSTCAILQLEEIGMDTDRCYVFDLRAGFRLKCVRDYANASSTGNRGVKKVYVLGPRREYIVSSPTSWGKTERYRCTVVNGEIVRGADC
jgi:hypothetical protein